MKSHSETYWFPGPTTYLKVISKGGRALVLHIIQFEPTDWRILAVEVAEKADTFNKIFADHSHAEVGRAKSLACGKKRATKYKNEWLKRFRNNKVKCNCQTIPDLP